MGNVNDGSGAKIPPDVGVIYVTEKDIHQWAEMFGEDEEECDDDDEDSNGIYNSCVPGHFPFINYTTFPS